MGRSRSRNKRAQVFAADFIMSIFIFSFVLIFMFKYTPRYQGQQFDTIEDVYFDAEIISNILRSKGYPQNWTYGYLEDNDNSRMGLMRSGYEMEEYKVQQMQVATLRNYTMTKKKFGVDSDYLVYFTFKNGTHANISNVTHLGDSDIAYDPSLKDVNISDLDPANLAMMKRVVVFNRSSYYMVVQAWN